MAVNKVVYNTENGAKTLIDLTGDTVTPETLAEGETAHDASGNVITGTMPTSAVRYTQQTLTEAQKAQARENIGAVAKSGISLGVHSDGLIYVFVDGSPVGDGIELATAGDVIGYVDENNNVILTGALADGTYNIKYEMADGSTVDIGDLVLDTNVYYSVTNTLTNCVSNNSAREVVEGESYSATITANEGYELSSVVVTMGGSPVSVTDGVINIASVTGNIVITAVAAEVKTETNFAEYNADNTSDWSIWINNARVGSDGTYRSESYNQSFGTPSVSNYIAVQNGDIVEFSGIYTSGRTSVLYDTNKGILANGVSPLPNLTNYLSDISLDGANYSGQFTVNSASVGYVRIGGYTYTPMFDIAIKIKRNGEYL